MSNGAPDSMSELIFPLSLHTNVSLSPVDGSKPVASFSRTGLSAIGLKIFEFGGAAGGREGQ